MATEKGSYSMVSEPSKPAVFRPIELKDMPANLPADEAMRGTNVVSKLEVPAHEVSTANFDVHFPGKEMGE